MLAGCPTLLSPRHRLKSEASVQLKACHFQQKLGSMSTQRLDLPCSFTRKEAAPRLQPSRAVGLSVEKPIEGMGNCSIRRNVRCPSPISTQSTFWEGRREIEDGFWEKKKKSLKRFSEQSSSEESCINRAKRKRSSSDNTTPDNSSEGERLSVSQLCGGDLWFHRMVEEPRSMLGITSLDPPPPPLPFSMSSSAEEERVCFPHTEPIFAPIPLLNNPWVESIVTEITDKGDKDADTSEGPKQTKSSSSTSSDTHSLSLKLNKNSSDHETGNGSQVPYHSEGHGAAGHENIHSEHQGLELVSLLMACVESIGTKNFAAISQFLSRLGQLASPEGTPIHRVVAYFTEAIAIRTVKLWPHIFHIVVPRDLDRTEDEVATAFQLLNHISPIPKFLHFTSNEMVLRAFEGKDRVHIIDFDIKQGLQWPGLFQSLASRPNPPTHVRITGIGESKQELQDTGERLAGFAAALNLPFEFHAVVDRLEDVRLWMLHVKEKETVAVNCMLQLHKALYDDNGGAFRDLLGLIRSTNPTVVLMAEQEADHNDASWETRFSNSMKYYSAIFDSIDSSLPLDSPARIKVEEMFAREIRNIVACEGNERIERHESFGTWRRLMEEGGFRCVGVGERETLQSRMLLKMFSCENYRVEKQGEDGGGLTLSWLDQPLYTVSAWAPVDFAGSSSSLSQPG
ncbi:scarecrow-like protein 28 [Magnolia sinica]|uniref:scarecrow-like protein 28 n=1 Tax=Magnolia sinica TaxID=86752 RepID=UPI00265A13FE|nr:scarecrow-like protein 28 [Magnolia sinica]